MNLQEKLYLQVQAAERLVEKWNGEAQRNEDRHDQSLSDVFYAAALRQCAKELEEALTK